MDEWDFDVEIWMISLLCRAKIPADTKLTAKQKRTIALSDMTKTLKPGSRTAVPSGNSIQREGAFYPTARAESDNWNFLFAEPAIIWQRHQRSRPGELRGFHYAEWLLETDSKRHPHCIWSHAGQLDDDKYPHQLKSTESFFSLSKNANAAKANHR